jgi:hypothetical protein
LSGGHAELFSIGSAEAFDDAGVSERLVGAFLQSVAARGGRRVRATANPGDSHTIDALETFDFAPSSATSHEPSPMEYWAQIN